MHQPFYKDMVADIYTMPWVRLHALKDYYGMVAMLREFPAVHVTFNLVPSLVVQILDYANGHAKERAYEVAFKPVEALTPVDRADLIATAFQLNKENLLNRYPRFRELSSKSLATAPAFSPRLFSRQELLDLQGVSQLAWFDEIFLAGDPAITALVKKGRSYSEDDKALVYNKELELFNKVLEEYKDASERGQIEISTSPFYHPILPLLCETNVAAESHPGIKLPRHEFRHPEDARKQLRAAVELHERVFGRRPLGLWPSEGSVSDQVLQLAVEEGFKWAATDEGVLGRTLQIGFYRQADGSVQGGHELYRPHRFTANGRSISLFFRDHQLSDLIGFVYSRMEPHAAAADLHQRIRAVASRAGRNPAVVSVILDGENAWEYYRGNGREFLKSLYGRIASDPEIRAVTASEAMQAPEQGVLNHIVPGSWINANFDVWIGADEDNRAWDLLTEAKDFLATNSRKPGLSPDQVQVAEEEIMIGEGSDWCWWYGPEHSTANDEEFDLLYRKHLSNVYRMLGASPSDELATPIKRPRVQAVAVAPTARISPRVDGQVTTYFEWLGAGVYVPDYRSGSMHGAAPRLEALYYGFSDKSLFLRLDFGEAFLKEHPHFEVRVNVNGKTPSRLHALVGQGNVQMLEFWKREEPLLVPLATGDGVQAAFGRILELKLDYGLLGSTSRDKIDLQVSLWAKELPLQVIPQDGWLTLELTEELTSW
jgi:alpha-amylase/alpha-mannosidase (GH57 family)